MSNKSANAQLVRIIGGKWRSRKIYFPDVPELRPTADRIRETLFNWLQGDIPGARCLDLFAGSGACGIEALSRGSARVVFLDSNRLAVDAIGQALNNLDAINYVVVCSDATEWLRQPQEDKFDIVFLDPPFDHDLAPQACELLEIRGLLAPGAKIYIESARPIETEAVPENWLQLRSGKAGSVYFYLYQSHGRSSTENDEQ
ncbi:MAG: 16S rRNA (guanine(966)-N(2))-methyltransferase RsmD [Pseudohongiellaceae bacterium]